MLAWECAVIPWLKGFFNLCEQIAIAEQILMQEETLVLKLVKEDILTRNQ